MPPLEFVCCTTSSVLTRIRAPSMAPTPVTSSNTPTLIGLPVGLPAAAAWPDVAGGLVAGEAGAGLLHAARTQASRPTVTSAREVGGAIAVLPSRFLASVG